MFIFPYLDHPQGYYDYWHRVYFKVKNFLKFYVQIFILLILMYSFADMLLSAGNDISIRKHVFFLLYSLTTTSGLLLFIFESVWIAEKSNSIFSIIVSR